MRCLTSRTPALCALAAFMVIVSACGEAPTAPKGERPHIPLNLETLEGETEFGTLRAQRAENSFVSPLGEGRAIGIAFLDDVTSEDRGPQEIVVYLYERQCLAVMIGSVDAEGFATLESDEHSDFSATVELVMEDDVVTGTVTFEEEAPTPFTASIASGVGGVYWAHGTDEHPNARADWVVLPDERQWGCVCVMPPMMPEHPCCQMLLF